MNERTIILNNEIFKNVRLTLLDNPIDNLIVPEAWENVTEFGKWWVENKMPIRFPVKPEVFRTDDATAITIFREGRFQVEMYLIHANPQLQDHEHPGVEVIKVRTGLLNGISLSDVLLRNQAHGSGMKLEAEKKGFPLLAIQHWQTREPNTIASMWKGYTAGPKHRSLILRYNPGCFVDGDYVDITLNSDGTPREF